MDIADWRLKIDEIDSRILGLLNERAQFSVNIGHIKERENLPIHSPEREQAIIERVQKENGGPLSSDGVRRVFERIIDESRRLEKRESKRRSKTHKEA